MKKLKDFISKNNNVSIIVLAITVLSLPFIVNQVLKRQDVRQRAQVAPSISFQISPATANIALQGQFSVDLIMNAGTQDIGSLEFAINYPSANLTLISDTLLPSYTIVKKQLTPGSYKVTLINLASIPVTGNGVKVVTFTFTGNINGAAKVKLDPATLKVTASRSNGFVTVNNPNLIEGNYTVGVVPTATPTPISPTACSVTTTPNYNLRIGNTGVVTANVTGLGNARVTFLTFGSYNTGVVSINPIYDTVSPYQTTITASSNGTTSIWGRARLSDGRVCQTTENTDSDIVVSPFAPTATPTPAIITTPTPTPAIITTPTLTPTPTKPVTTTDLSAPTISITSPVSGSTVAINSAVAIKANASDDVGVRYVYFYVNGVSKCLDTSSPYQCNWEVGSTPNTSYAITAQAYDASGKNKNDFVSVTSK